MSLDGIIRVKNGKYFRPWDILLYAAVLSLAVAAIIVLSVLSRGDSLVARGAVAEITAGGEVVFTFDFASNSYTAKQSDSVAITVASADNKTTITVVQDNNRRNEIVFDVSGGGKVTCFSANCSFRHDCTYMSIQNASDTIICVPHALRVYIVSDGLIPPVTG